MLVQCPGCHTTYRVSENVVTKSKPTFRCSRCKNIFVLGSRAGANSAHEPPEPPPSPAIREEARELSFSFPAPAPSEKSGEEIAAGPESSLPGNGPAVPEKESSFIIRKREDDWSIDPRHGGAGESFTMKGEKSFAEFDKPAERSFDFARDWPAIAKHEEAAGDASAGSSPSRPLSVAPYLLLCGVLMFFFSSVALLYKARPEPVESVLKTVPWIGSSVLRNDHLRQGIVLQTSRPRFQRIQGNREVFLLSGVAVNRNRVRVREVKIEGYIFGADGKVIERRVITVGNAISSKLVRDLTAQEISNLQKEGPVRRFEILPDESAAFSIVFLKSDPGLKSFGYRVLSAEEAWQTAEKG